MRDKTHGSSSAFPARDPQKTLSEGSASENDTAEALMVFDRQTFLQLGEGNPERLRRLVDAFSSSAKRTLDDLASALTESNAEVAGQLGHKLKSGARWMGALQLATLAEELEQSVPSDRIGTGKALQSELMRQYTNALRQMELFLSNLKALQEGDTKP